MKERDIVDYLAEQAQGQREVPTPVGKIDVLTSKVLYEVKAVRQWKAALGQVQAYARFYPSHRPKLYLYGTAPGKLKAEIEATCRALGVGVVYHREPLTEAEQVAREARRMEHARAAQTTHREVYPNEEPGPVYGTYGDPYIGRRLLILARSQGPIGLASRISIPGVRQAGYWRGAVSRRLLRWSETAQLLSTWLLTPDEHGVQPLDRRTRQPFIAIEDCHLVLFDEGGFRGKRASAQPAISSSSRRTLTALPNLHTVRYDIQSVSDSFRFPHPTTHSVSFFFSATTEPEPLRQWAFRFGDFLKQELLAVRLDAIMIAFWVGSS